MLTCAALTKCASGQLARKQYGYKEDPYIYLHEGETYWAPIRSACVGVKSLHNVSTVVLAFRSLSTPKGPNCVENIPPFGPCEVDYVVCSEFLSGLVVCDVVSVRL